MTTYSQIEGSSNLLRDLNSKAIINTDLSKREAYLRSRSAIEQKEKEMAQMKEQLNSLSGDVSFIKEMLSKLIGKIGNE